MRATKRCEHSAALRKRHLLRIIRAFIAVTRDRGCTSRAGRGTDEGDEAVDGGGEVGVKPLVFVGRGRVVAAWHDERIADMRLTRERERVFLDAGQRCLPLQSSERILGLQWSWFFVRRCAPQFELLS